MCLLLCPCRKHILAFLYFSVNNIIGFFHKYSTMPDIRNKLQVYWYYLWLAHCFYEFQCWSPIIVKHCLHVWPARAPAQSAHSWCYLTTDFQTSLQFRVWTPFEAATTNLTAGSAWAGWVLACWHGWGVLKLKRICNERHLVWLYGRPQSSPQSPSSPRN